MRSFSSVRRLQLLAAVLLVAAIIAIPTAPGRAGEEKFLPPKTYPAQTYPARDDHPQEQVSIAADPYDLPDKAAIFRVDYKDADFLPIQLIVTNDSDQTLELAGMKVEFVTVHRDKLLPAGPADIYRRIARQGSRPDLGRQSTLPFPHRKMKPSVSKQDQAEIQDAGFAWTSVPPHTTRAGFFFFDVEGVRNPLAGANLYVSGLRAGGRELMFFQISMEKYLTYQPGSK